MTSPSALGFIRDTKNNYYRATNCPNRKKTVTLNNASDYQTIGLG